MAKKWNWLRTLATFEWVENIWHIYTMKWAYFWIQFKKNEILSFIAIWMELEETMLSEIKKGLERKMLRVLTYMWKLKK